MPRSVGLVFAVVASLGLLPFACAYKARWTPSARPRIHLVQDMDNQPRFESQQANPLFADGRAMRPWPEGTVPRGALLEDERVATGRENGRFVERIPIPVDEALVRRGRDRYDIFCSPCHGLSGYGDGIVARRAEKLQEGGFVPPASFHQDTVRARPDGYLYNAIANGVRTMPAYGSQIGVRDRWAIVSYVRALERSQRATLEDVPEDLRGRLR